MNVRRTGAGSRLFPGAPYSYGTEVAPGTVLVFLAGACPIDASGAVVTPGDLVAQADLAMDNLVVALDEAGCSLADVVRTTVLVATTDHAELVAGWEAVRARLGEIDPPSTLVGVTVLGYSGQLIEVEAVAARPAREADT